MSRKRKTEHCAVRLSEAAYNALRSIKERTGQPIAYLASMAVIEYAERQKGGNQ